MKKQNFILAGEAMGLFIAREEGPLDQVSSWDSGVAGAELNVAIGLARLGHHVSYLTAVGDDVFGKRIIHLLLDNGIDSSLVHTDCTRATGFMLKGKVTSGDPPIQYFRRGSAASALNSDQVLSCLSGKKGGFLHVTGILPALSESTLAATKALMRYARQAGMKISFDPNLRPQLWKDPETMRDILNQLAINADLFLPGINEGVFLCGLTDPADIARYYLDRGTETVIIKNGAIGAYAASQWEAIEVPSFPVKEVVDTVGAGDGFAAGVLSALAEGCSLYESVQRGNALGALQVMSPGDNTGLPTRTQLEHFMNTASEEVQGQ